MRWPDNKLEPIEEYLYQGRDVRIGKFDCRADHESFPLTESVADDMFVLATRPIWLRRGTRSFQYISPASVLLHTAGATIERRQDPGGRDLAYWFSVQPGEFSEALSSHGLTSSVPRSGMHSSPQIQLRFASIVSEVNATRPCALSIESQVLALLDEICRSAATNAGKTRNPVVRTESRAKAKRLVDCAREFIDNNLVDDTDLGTIASEVGLSSFYLCRLFKSMSGMSLHEYRIRQRLSLVLDRLSSGQGDDLSRLALDSGFSSHSHLTRTFSRRYGMPPSSFRKFVVDRPPLAANSDSLFSRNIRSVVTRGL